MLNITYAPADIALAEQMQVDLAKAELKTAHKITIVVLSPASVTDNDVLGTIKYSQEQGQLLVPVMVEKTRIPDSLQNLPVLDMSGGYEPQKLIRAIRRADIEKATIRRNRSMLVGLLAIVAIVFSIAVWSISQGIILFPEDEFATENALIEQRIETLTYPTIGPLIPRTTEDAIAFPRTVEAANTRNAPLLRMTASALPVMRQATAEAIVEAAEATSTARAEATQAAED